MRIIGIDPGTAIVGYGIADVENGECELVTSGSVQTDKNLPDSERLLEIQKDLSEIITKYKPDTASVEKLFFFKNQKTIISVAQSRGVILATLAQFGINIFEYTPLQIKLTITGYGKATKEDVADMVKRQIKYNHFPKLDDTADAIAMAVCHAKISGG
ncbi:MAG: crossover junction endodeoxyribonuclease RuvC [Candidatus Gastranaerophilales bacterium]|nr:crossover junction endodeoxyribonuclease RuvC [Candidatus Gastranaerophilales bacterium]